MSMLGPRDEIGSVRLIFCCIFNRTEPIGLGRLETDTDLLMEETVRFGGAQSGLVMSVFQIRMVATR